MWIHVPLVGGWDKCTFSTVINLRASIKINSTTVYARDIMRAFAAWNIISIHNIILFKIRPMNFVNNDRTILCYCNDMYVSSDRFRIDRTAKFKLNGEKRKKSRHSISGKLISGISLLVTLNFVRTKFLYREILYAFGRHVHYIKWCKLFERISALFQTFEHFNNLLRINYQTF